MNLKRLFTSNSKYLNIVFRAGLFCISLVLVLILFAIYFPVDRFTGKDLHYALPDKEALLIETKSDQRIILVGGSNVSFGVNSGLLEEALGVKVINMAIHAGYGLNYQIKQVVPHLESGDIVIVIPEYEQFVGRRNGEGRLLFRAVNASPKSIRYLNLDQFRKIALYVPQFVVSVLNQEISGDAPYWYKQVGFNEFGDVEAHWSTTVKSGRNQATALNNDIDEYDVEAIKILEKFAATSKEKEVVVFISFPSINESSYVISDRLIEQVHDDLKAAELQLLGNPSRYVIDDELHFDTRYHLSQEGQYIRSKLLFEDLINSQINSPIELDFEISQFEDYSPISQNEVGIKFHKKALTLNPNNTKAHLGLGSIYRMQEEYDLSVKSYSTVIELDPTLIDGYIGRGQTYLKAGEFESAIVDFSKSIELNPNRFGLYMSRGNAFRQANKFDSAIKDFSKAIELDPANSNAYVLRGNSYFQQEQFLEAIGDFNDALQIEPERIGVYMIRGRSYEALGDFEMARQNYNQVLKLDNENQEAVSRLNGLE